MDEVANPHADQTNDHRYDDLVKVVQGLGRDAAEGKDALPKLAHAVVRAAHEGVIDTQKDNDGNDGAARVYYKYAEQQSKRAIHEHSEGGVKANISKLRKLLEMGSMPIIDPVDVMNRAATIREDMRQNGEEMKPAYASYVDIAREQLNNPGKALDDDELKACISKSPRPDKTLEDELRSIHKKLDGLVSGDNAKKFKDQSSEIIQAEELLRQRLASFMIATSQAEFGSAYMGNAAPAA